MSVFGLAHAAAGGVRSDAPSCVQLKCCFLQVGNRLLYSSLTNAAKVVGAELHSVGGQHLPACTFGGSRPPFVCQGPQGLSQCNNPKQLEIAENSWKRWDAKLVGRSPTGPATMCESASVCVLGMGVCHEQSVPAPAQVMVGGAHQVGSVTG